MELPKKFYEDEIRDGFYVPAQVKQAWAISLEVISEIDKVCKKHGIKYFADYGTFLGAVRHGGVIPWDDDFDICMLRSDYERFLEVAPDELPHEYAIENIRSHEEHWDFNFFLARVINKNRICFEKEHLEKYHGFPYMCGTDIFVVDNISDDAEKEDARIRRSFECLARAEIARNEHGNRAEEQKWLLQTEKEFALFNDEKTKYVSEMIQFGLKKKRYIEAASYGETYYLDFENTKIPVLGNYEGILSIKYGNYIKPAPDVAGHDYPFFEGQQHQLEEAMGFNVPEYVFSKEDLKRNYPNASEGRKKDAKEYAEYLRQLTECVLNSDEGIKSDIEERSQKLVECQQFAIDFGTWIEGLKGEGTKTVALLEKYCEAIAHIYEKTTGDIDYRISDNDLSNLLQLSEDVLKSITEEIVNKREVVFMPFSPEYWASFTAVYNREISRDDTDVYVVPVPYFYKNYDGTLKDMQYDMSAYPAELHVVSVDNFDFELHKPDTIYIQNPYDSWNAETSIHPDYYSDKLLQYTEKLVYIPWFQTSEFSKKDERAYHNMKYYCTMPGVIRADEVLVQSDNIRNLYVDKLCEFAGEETRSIWEKKISSLEKTICEEKQHKKKVLFSVCPATAAEKQEIFFAKLDQVLDIFKQSKDKLTLVWNNPIIDCKVTKEHETYLKRLSERYLAYCKEGWGEYSNSCDYKDLCNACDAYYGTANKLAYQCFVLKKPVMVTEEL